MDNIDFKARDTGRELILSPVSEIAKSICRHYKGVTMNNFYMPYGNYDRFIETYSNMILRTLTVEISAKEDN
jgi:hypothetical protein